MPRTRIKICGITRPEDAEIVADLGADAIGLNLFSGPRRIKPDDANDIFSAYRKGTELGDDNHWICDTLDVVTLCALNRKQFPDSIAWDQVKSVAGFTPTFYQIYGGQQDEIAGSFLLQGKWWMVLPVSTRGSLTDAAVALGMLKNLPTALLLDTAHPTQLGGTGQSFNWHWIAEAREAGELNGLPPIILAGGLNPDNVADAIRIARPYAVDVSSGVEVPGHPGIKDPARLRAFIQAVHAADAALTD